jgi:hypothetical protein
MFRMLLCSLAGAGAGFLVCAVALCILTSGQPTAGDIGIMVVLGLFIAGMGAIAGAIVGGTADLREYFKRRDRESRYSQDRDM